MNNKLDQFFNKIFVIESLGKDDAKTGSDFYNRYLKSKVEQIQEIEAELVTPNTKDEFFTFLNRVANEVQTNNLLPIFHFEIHGSPEGLRLSSGDFINWENLYSILTQINVKIGNNLLITLAVCCGNYLARIINLTKRAPVWGLISIWEEAWDYDLMVSFQEFYDELLNSLDGDKAIKRLNDANPDKKYTYRLINCQGLFKLAYKLAYKEHIRINHKPEALEKRVSKMFPKAKNLPRFQGLKEDTIKRKLKMELINLRMPMFEKHKACFFMYDLYPENRDRFRILYKDVMADGN